MARTAQAEAAKARCRTCDGFGCARNPATGLLNPNTRCPTCGGTGRVAAAPTPTERDLING